MSAAPPSRRRHSTIATHTDASRNAVVEGLQQSLEENAYIFDWMAEIAFIEYGSQPAPGSRWHRQVGVASEWITDVEDSNEMLRVIKHPRRHSSFETRQAYMSYNDHKQANDFWDSLANPEATERANLIRSLLEFDVSVSMASLSTGTSATHQGAGSRYSCPILSYINDDADNVASGDLRTYNSNLVPISKRESIFQTSEEQRLCLTDDDSADLSRLEDYPTQYNVEMKSVLDDETKPRSRRRRSTPSYKLLSQKLATEHPHQVIRSLMDNNTAS